MSYDGTILATTESVDDDEQGYVASSSSSPPLYGVGNAPTSVDKTAGDDTGRGIKELSKIKETDEGGPMIEESISFGDGTALSGFVDVKLPLKIKLLNSDLPCTSQESPEVIHAKEKAAKERQNLKALINAVETETVRAKTAFDERKKIKDDLINEMGIVDATHTGSESSLSSPLFESSVIRASSSGQSSPMDFLTSPQPPPSSLLSHHSGESGPSSPDSYASNSTGNSSIRSPRINTTNEAELERVKEEKRLAEIVAVITRRRIAEEKRKHHNNALAN